MYMYIYVYYTILYMRMQSYADWLGDIGWGGYAEHPQTPLVYAREWEKMSE